MWAIRDMRIVLPGRALAAAGQGMVLVALLLLLHDSGAGPAATTALLCCLAIPTIVWMGAAGRAADRYDSRRLLVAGHAVEAVACLGLVLLTAFAAPWWSVLPMVALLQTGAAFTTPVWSALVPRIVGEERIGPAISWQQGLSTALSPVGAATAGVLYGTVGPAPALLGAAVLMSALAAASMAVRTRRGDDSTSFDGRDGSLDDRGAGPESVPDKKIPTLSGFRLIRSDALLWPLFASLFVLVIAVEGTNVVEVFLARDELGASAEQYGFTEFCFAGGAVVGALLAGRFSSTRARLTATLVGFGGTAAAVAAAGASPNFWFYLCVAVAVGLANACGNAANGALLMSRIPDAARGRVSSTLSGVMRLASVTALALGGVSGTLFGPRPTFLVGGLLGLTVIMVSALSILRRPNQPSGGDDRSRPRWLRRSQLAPYQYPQRSDRDAAYRRQPWSGTGSCDVVHNTFVRSGTPM